jgi:hypothetical protein
MSKEKTHLGRIRDRKLVAGLQDYEVQTVVDHMKAEGIVIGHDEVKALVKEVGHDRDTLYATIKDRYVANDNETA